MLFLFIFVLHPLKFFILLVRPFRAALGHGEKRKCPVTANFPLDLRICFKASPSAKPFMWKWVLFTCKWTQIFMQTLDPKRWERFEEQGARQKVHILGLKCPNWFLTLSVSDKQFQRARQSVCRLAEIFDEKMSERIWRTLTQTSVCSEVWTDNVWLCKTGNECRWRLLRDALPVLSSCLSVLFCGENWGTNNRWLTKWINAVGFATLLDTVVINPLTRELFQVICMYKF